MTQSFVVFGTPTWQKVELNLQMSLRRKQIEVALKGNVSMLIWLGKQMLGQMDKQELIADDKGFKIVVEDYAKSLKEKK